MADKDKYIKDNATRLAEDENKLLLAEKSGSRQDIASTYISDIEEKQTQEKKEKRARRSMEAVLQAQQLENDLDALLDRMKEIREQLDLIGKRINKGQRLLDEGNVDAINIHLMTEYDISDAELGSMSDSDKKQLLGDKIQDDKLTESQLESEYKRVDQEFQEKLDSDEFKNLPEDQRTLRKTLYQEEANAQINDLNSRASHLDTENILTKVRVDNNGESSLLQSTQDDSKYDEYSTLEHGRDGNDSYASFASSVSDDPFATSAESITDPFNQVSSQPDIQPTQPQIDQTVNNDIQPIEPASMTIK